MSTMNTTATRAAAVASAVSELNLATCGVQIDTNEFVYPVDVEGVTRYVGIKLSVKNNKDTKTTTAFNLDNAVAAWEEKKAEALAKASAPKKSKKSTSRRKKEIEEDEDEE